MPQLIIRQGGKIVDTVIMEADELLLGRQGDIVINDAMASRKHAKIIKEKDGRYALEHLGSQNTTKLNGLEIEREYLNDHDEIQIGTCTIIFILMKTQESPSAASDPMATDVTGRGVMTFDESNAGDLGEKLRGILNQAKQNQSSGQTIISKKKTDSGMGKDETTEEDVTTTPDTTPPTAGIAALKHKKTIFIIGAGILTLILLLASLLLFGGANT